MISAGFELRRGAEVEVLRALLHDHRDFLPQVAALEDVLQAHDRAVRDEQAGAAASRGLEQLLLQPFIRKGSHRERHVIGLPGGTSRRYGA